ncbi:MAG: hypothetical protein CMJ83_03310 [Planctomycetes bacterium]|nr:hypothetical protein [Planctomycetota bacterium]
MSTRLLVALIAIACAVILPACGGDDTSSSDAPESGTSKSGPPKPDTPKPDTPKPGTPKSAIPEARWSSTPLANAEPVGKVRADAKDGAEVIISGKVKQFVEGRAALTLVDIKLKSCDQLEGDNCETPWDYCCVDPTEIAANAITVEVRSSDNRLIREGLKGFHGLDHLQTLSVCGKLSRDDAGNVTVVATSIYRQ